MTQQELTIIILFSACVVFGLLLRASKALKKVTNFLLFFRNIVQKPFSFIGKKLIIAFKNAFNKNAPVALKEFSETRLKPWGGFGTVVLFGLVTITNIVVILVALFSPNLNEKLVDFFTNTALFSFIALIEPLLDGSFNIFAISSLCEVGLTACLTMICMKNIQELNKWIQLLYTTLFTLFSSFIGYLIPNSLIQFITNIFETMAHAKVSKFFSIFWLILVIILLFIAIAVGLVALTEYVAMIRYSLIISGVLMIILIVGDMLFPKVLEILIPILFLPAVIGAEFWRYKMAEKD